MAAKETEKMTIEQVADALGVSKTTVSRALSGKGRISEETRTKVYAYMGRTRSEPVSAQSGEKLRTNNIAMVVPQRFIALDLPFLRKCMGGICTMADQRGYDLMAFQLPHDDLFSGQPVQQHPAGSLAQLLCIVLHRRD